MLGFVVIVILYPAIGFMAAAGVILIARKVLAPKAEQIFYDDFAVTSRCQRTVRLDNENCGRQ